MKKRLIILAEGPTEKEFVHKVLSNYLENYFVSITSFCFKKTRGGISKYTDLTFDVKKLINESNVLVTMMVDYYRFPNTFPKVKESKNISDMYERIDFLENAIKEDINAENFIPYIQLHEFETLLFSDKDRIINIYEEKNVNHFLLEKTLGEYINIEMINTNKSPATRLKEITNLKYSKGTDASNLAKDIGIEKMLEKCKHFSDWIEKLKSHS